MSKIVSTQLETPNLRASGLRWLLAAIVVSAWMLTGMASTIQAMPLLQEKEQTEEEHSHEGEGEHSNEDGDHSHDDDHHGDGHHYDDHSKDPMDYFLSANHLVGHTQDKPYFERPSFRDREGNFSLFGDVSKGVNVERKHIYIPQISPWSDKKPLMKQPEGKLGEFLGPITFQPTKFIILQLLAGLFVGGAFIMLGKKIQNGDPAKGRFWNMLEAGVVYIRDEVAKPAIGSHDYKHFVPLLWTIFFFILTMNLMGMFPLLGTATGNISVTSALALAVFAVVLFTGMKKLGVVGFWKAQAPHMDLPGPLKIPMTVGIWCIEVFGLFIKHMVLAVRLFANMFAGHLVLAVFVGFIGVTWGTGIGWIVTPASLGGSVAIGLLEILVAFIQAYVFTFLTALFIGAAVHPH